MAADADVFLNSDEFGVPCVLYTQGETREIVVILDKVEDADTGLFYDAVTAKHSDVTGVVPGDRFVISGNTYRAVSGKPLFEDEQIATLRLEK